MLVRKNLKRNVNNYKPIKRRISELFLFRVKAVIWLHFLCTATYYFLFGTLNLKATTNKSTIYKPESTIYNSKSKYILYLHI